MTEHAHGGHRARCLETCTACFQSCNACFQACNAALLHCIEKLAAGETFYAMCATLFADCPEFCITCERLMTCKSGFTEFSAYAGAQACLACVVSCDEHAADAVLVSLAKTCRKCAESCTAMHKIPHP